MTEFPFIASVHLIAGSTVVIAGFGAMGLPKGHRLHRLCGNVFFLVDANAMYQRHPVCLSLPPANLSASGCYPYLHHPDPARQNCKGDCLLHVSEQLLEVDNVAIVLVAAIKAICAADGLKQVMVV